MDSIVDKEMNQLRRDYGDLLITHNETQHELHLLRNEYNNLTARLTSFDGEIQSLNDQFALKIRDYEAEIKILKKQKMEMSEDIVRLESLKVVMEDQCQELKKENVKLEELRKKDQELMEELKVSKERKQVEFNKLKNKYDAVIFSASISYKELGDRVTSLENDVSVLKHDSPNSDLFQAEVDITASSMPGSKTMTPTHVLTHPESSESNAKLEKSASSMPNASKPPLVSSSIIDLENSDDDMELPSPTPLKRKVIETTSGSDKKEGESVGSIKYKKDNENVLQPCIQNVVGLESKKGWEFEADMLESFQHDTELCLKAVCALSRQHMLSLREKALAKFLTDGDVEGRLRKTLIELEAFDREGAYECRRIASIHYKELFDIYKRGIDPFFAPDTISS